MGSARRLFVLHPSPWSERARWALDHHRLTYESIHYLPFIGQGQLKRLAGTDTKRVTVPFLVADGQTYGESWAIALYADREGGREKLVPSDLEEDIRLWNQVADGGMGGVRGRVLARMLESPKALDIAAPPVVPRWLRPAMRPAARWTIRHLQRKYQTRSDEGASQVLLLRSALDRLRDGLKGGKPYLLGKFTYADIVMATLLQGVLPVTDLFLRLPRALREVWTDDTLAREYGDLLTWRDELYERHRRDLS